MNGLFGIFNLNGKAASPEKLSVMRAALLEAGYMADPAWSSGPMGFAPSSGAKQRFPPSGNELVAFSGRIDNRADLFRALGISRTAQQSIPNSDLVSLAFEKWGESTPERIYGDWAFALWNPETQRLFVARDHCGNTALFFLITDSIFAFASSVKALLAASLVPVQLDELYAAQVLIAWPAYHGERTIHRPIRRLPPAHFLTVTPEQFRINRYWRLEETSELRLGSTREYVDGLRDIFDEAVRARLQDADGVQGSTAVTLSGGLDSGSVAVTAAAFFKRQNKRLAAFTSVPLTATEAITTKRFGNEWPYALATAEHAGNVDLHPIDAARVGPIQAIHQALAIYEEPLHAAGNLYWLLELERTVRAMGCSVLLTGQGGNAGLSWTGNIASQATAVQLRSLGLRKFAFQLFRRGRQRVFRNVPSGLRASIHRWRVAKTQWYRGTAIHPMFADRLQLLEQRIAGERTCVTPLEQRCDILQPGRSQLGCVHAALGASAGLEVRDPTLDARLLSYTLSIPDHVFIDPKTGLDRWPVRAAMDGRLPDLVRLNRRRGLQATDLVPRLRNSAGEVHAALDDISRGPAADYVDVPHIRKTWEQMRYQDVPRSRRDAVCIVTRGIMGGLFINRFFGFGHAVQAEEMACSVA